MRFHILLSSMKVKARCIYSSVGWARTKKSKVPQLLYFGTESFEQFRFQSIQVPIPKPLVPPDLEPKWSWTSAIMHKVQIAP